MTSTPTPRSTRTNTILQLLLSLIHLVAVLAVTAWGFLSWPLPFPGILTGILTLVLAVLLWALFLSPRPVLRVDRFARALFELLLLASAAGALLALGAFWALPVALFVGGAVLGYLTSTRAR